MTSVLTDAVRELREGMLGRVLAPADRGYDAARSVWNGDIDRRPALIALCRSAADVAAALATARRHGLDVTVRGGGHSVPGQSVADDALMIHLGEMRDVRVDPQARIAVVQGGATLADLDAATQAHGLAVPAGVVSHTGVSGLTLGGGVGWLTRRAGLTIDNLLSAEVVTADGRILRTDEARHPDLFWAIRGAGGNFGVVTEFEFALHEIGPTVRLGICFWGLEDGAAVLRLAEELHTALPRDLTIGFGAMSAPPAPFVPPEHHLRPGYLLMLVDLGGDGADGRHEATLARIRAAVPPVFEFAAPLPYVELQKMTDEGSPWGTFSYERGCYLERLTDGAVEAITTLVPRKTSPQSIMMFMSLSGAYCDVADDDTAFGGHRTPRYAIFLAGAARTADLLAADAQWVRDMWQALQPFAGAASGYVNTLDRLADDRVRLLYGHKYERLATIKAAYDPDNVFHHNANILPAAVPEAGPERSFR